MLCIEGKENNWCDACAQSFHKCSDEEQLILSQLASDVYDERIEASKVQYSIYDRALQWAARGDVRLERSWLSFEVQHMVAQHMGWLSKALDAGMLIKVKTTRKGALRLGEMGSQYEVHDWRPNIGKQCARKIF